MTLMRKRWQGRQTSLSTTFPADWLCWFLICRIGGQSMSRLVADSLVSLIIRRVSPTALRWFLDHPVEMRAMGERGRQKIATEWNYEMELLPRSLNG